MLLVIVLGVFLLGDIGCFVDLVDGFYSYDWFMVVVDFDVYVKV